METAYTEPDSLQHRTLEEICSEFVLRVSSYAFVREVRLMRDADGPSVWVIISAPRFDFQVRRQIYEAQAEVLRSSEGPLLDFRLININELPPEAAGVPEVASAMVLLRR